jgi:ribosomal protein L11 methyltransferase
MGMTRSGGVCRVHLQLRGADAADAVFALLDDITATVSAFETTPEEWRIEAYPTAPVLTPGLRAQLALAAVAAGGALIEIGEDTLPARDWLTENQLAFPPLRIGRFFIYGSHYDGRVPVGAIGIAVDAATAFGTGEHPSTRACLVVLERLARRRRFSKPLDVGTGTGILSIAAAKLLRRKVLAGDIDPGAVRVARHNVARNGVRSFVRVREALGYRDRAMCRSRYDLILSNILARPLAVMAPELARALAPGGRAVLSGLLRWQEPIVLAPHRVCGIVLDHRLVIDGWSTLVMRRRRMPEMKTGADAPTLEFGSVKRPVRLPLAGRDSFALRTPLAARSGSTCGSRRRGLRFATDGARYRRANDHRAPSVRSRPVPAYATRKRPFLLI